MQTHQRRAPRFVLSDDEVVALGRGEALVRDRFLGVSAARAVARSLPRWRPRLVAARMGPGETPWLDRTERGDDMAWVEPGNAGPALHRLFRGYDAVMRGVNRAAYLGLRRFDVQVACYPGRGERYARHADAFRARFEVPRLLTAIYYANPQWQPADGGLLRVYTVAAGERDVAPLLDRLVLFLSDRVEHEVTACHRERWAVTAWFYADA